MSTVFQVLSPGFLTTVQDKGVLDTAALECQSQEL